MEAAAASTRPVRVRGLTPGWTLAAVGGYGYQVGLAAENYGMITTEIIEAPEFFYAEAYHQQYLAKNPQGYCGLGGTGVCYV